MNIFLKPHEAILGKGETPFGRNVTIYAWCVCCGLGDTFLDKEIPCYVTTLKLSETFFLSNVDNATCFTISHNLPNGFYFEDNRFSLPFHYIIIHITVCIQKNYLYRVVSITERWRFVIKLPFKNTPLRTRILLQITILLSNIELSL